MARVLIVDDEPLLCEELGDSLELEGFDVEMAHCVPDGLDVVANAQIDAVVTDLKMPQIGGLEFIRQLKERAYSGVVVVVSGHGAQSSREDAMALGAHACLAKPVDVDAVVEAIQTHLS